MSRYEKLSRGRLPNRPDPAPGLEIFGQYACQFCPEVVDEATYRPHESLLSYVCSNGHVSVIEGFSLA